MIEQLNAALVAKLAADKLLRARKLRVDTTVVEADIDYPTDADLLEQAVRKLGGLVRRIKGRGAASRTRFRDRGRAAGRRMKQLARTLRRRTGVAMAEVDRLTGEVAGIARQHPGAGAGGGAQRPPGAGAADPAMGGLGRLVGELDETITATQRLLAQTDQRLAGNRVIPDRLVSLARPGRPPDPQGQAPASRPSSATPCWWPRTNAGSSPTTSSSRATHPTRRSWSRPSQRVMRGHRPGAGHGGRRPRVRHRRQRPGPGKRWASSGSGCSAPARPGKARLAVERTRPFRRLRNWRVGIEARISHLKRCFGLRRTRLRRLGGARTWVGLGIFAYNLQRMTVVAG